VASLQQSGPLLPALCTPVPSTTERHEAHGPLPRKRRLPTENPKGRILRRKVASRFRIDRFHIDPIASAPRAARDVRDSVLRGFHIASEGRRRPRPGRRRPARRPVEIGWFALAPVDPGVLQLPRPKRDALAVFVVDRDPALAQILNVQRGFRRSSELTSHGGWPGSTFQASRPYKRSDIAPATAKSGAASTASAVILAVWARSLRPRAERSKVPTTRPATLMAATRAEPLESRTQRIVPVAGFRASDISYAGGKCDPSQRGDRQPHFCHFSML